MTANRRLQYPPLQGRKSSERCKIGQHPGYCYGGEECCCPQLSRIPGGKKKRGDNRRSVHTSNDVNVDPDPQSVYQICPPFQPTGQPR